MLAAMRGGLFERVLIELFVPPQMALVMLLFVSPLKGSTHSDWAGFFSAALVVALIGLGLTVPYSFCMEILVLAGVSPRSRQWAITSASFGGIAGLVLGLLLDLIVAGKLGAFELIFVPLGTIAGAMTAGLVRWRTIGAKSVASRVWEPNFGGMALSEIKVEIPSVQAEAADNVLLELGVAGWSVLEDVIEKRAWVAGIFANDVERDEKWVQLQPLLGEAGVPTDGTRTLRELADADWRDSYKAHFHAWQFGRLHWVPVWQRDTFQLPAGDAVLWLDPGLAFGTGNHETTRLCVERLVKIAGSAKKPDELRVIDAGCGSGILALSAALLGFGDIDGFDNDAEAVRVSEENAALNGLAGRVAFFTGDLVTGLAGRQAEVVLANIQADVLGRFAKELLSAVVPGGTLVLSGILAQERDAVRDRFAQAAPGWSVDSRIMGEWSDVVLVRPL